MNSRKKGTVSEVNITLTMIWCQIVIHTAGPYDQILGWYSMVFYFILTLTIVY
jgi:hypothetical protein